MRNTIIIAAALVALGLAGCGSHEAIVAEVGKDDITLREYEALYSKSNGGREQGEKADQEERERFLDLMVRYRLKLADAYAAGLDRRPDVREEINQYKGSLARSYLTERTLIRPAVQMLTDRRTQELRASHILLELPPDASPEDSAEAYRQAYDIIREARAGRDFTALVRAFSKDPSAGRNDGDLYYFTSGQMVPEFEDAAYALTVGEVTPDPVRTRYGLHIIRLTDRRAAPGEVRASHIMIRFPSATPTPEDTAAAYARIQVILDSLRSGEDFAALARRNSEDGGSATAGGDLNWFTRRRWVQPFDEVAMTMQPGDTSGIVRSPFGYHLILCTDRRPPKSAEELVDDIKRQYQSTRFSDEFAAMMARIKREVSYTRNDSVLALFYGALDTTGTTADSGWVEAIPPSVAGMTLMRIGGAAVTVDSLAGRIRDRADLGVLHLKERTLAPAVEKVTEDLLFAAEADRLASVDPEFAALLREYREGILLYQVEQDNVWSQVASSDSTLRAFFDERRDQFTYTDRVRFSELRLAGERAAQHARARLEAGATLEQVAREDSLRMAQPSELALPLRPGSSRIPQPSADALRQFTAELTADSLVRLRLLVRADTTRRAAENVRLARRRLGALHRFATGSLGIDPSRVDTMLHRGAGTGHQDTATVSIVGRQRRVNGTVTTATLAPEADPRARRADALSPGGVSEPFVHNTATVIVRLDAREPARRKTFEEAAPEVATAFQDYESRRLEEEWIRGLMTRFPVTKHPEVLHQAFSQNR